MNPMIILGPPGCGKTTTLLDMVDKELDRGVPADRVAYVTFTKRAAEEAVTRAVKKFNLSRNQLPFFRTLHSLCYRALGLQSSDVLNRTKLMEFADWIGVRITGRWTEDGSLTGYEIGDRILHLEHLSRVRMTSLREQYDLDDDGLPWDLVDRIGRAYSVYKRDQGLLDYTDMLSQFLQSGIKLRLDTVLDDEAQDQSRLQWAVLHKLAKNAQRVYVAGDDDQALYKWAGADVESFVDLPGEINVLGQSYRVPKEIQKTAMEIIGGVQHRREKKWQARPETGEIALCTNFDEVDCSRDETLILCRNIYLLREIIEPALKRQGIIYEYNGHSSVPASILGAIVSWERLRAGETVTILQARSVYDYMSSGQGVARGFKKLQGFPDDTAVSLAELKAQGGLLRDDIWHEALDRIPSEELGYILAARKRGEKLLTTMPRVRISTVHSAKGGEATHVVLLKEMAKRTYREMEIDEDSERRVAYVGVTRAKERLTIVEASTQQAWPWL
jgi:DNA helicase II / ATP-dependent DNA helicase PcrA